MEFVSYNTLCDTEWLAIYTDYNAFIQCGLPNVQYTMFSNNILLPGVHNDYNNDVVMLIGEFGNVH